jgi:hypothetical protein
MPAHSPWQTAGNSLLFKQRLDPMANWTNGREPTAAVAAEGVRDRTPPGIGTVLLNVAGFVCALIYLVMLAVNPLDSRASFPGTPAPRGLLTGSL